MLGTGLTKITAPLGLIDVRTNGVTPGEYTPSQKWLNALLAPSLEVPGMASYYAGWWDHVFARINQTYTGDQAVSSAALLCGEPAAIDAALNSWRLMPDSQGDPTSDYYYEMDVSALSDKFSTSMLLGATPGYTGYQEDGSPFIKAINAIRARQEEYDSGDSNREGDWERPLPVLVFKNIHRTHPTVQAVLAGIAVGHITTCTGDKISLNGAQIVFTAPGTRPIGAEAQTTGDKVISGLLELNGPEGKLFAPELLNAIVAIHFPEPDIAALMATTSHEIGRACLTHLLSRNQEAKTTLRHYGDASLVAAVLRNAGLAPGMDWEDMLGAVRQAAMELAEGEDSTSTHDTPPLTAGTLWSRCTDGTIKSQNADLDEIAEMESDFTLPVDFVERSGIKVSPIAYWGELAKLDTVVVDTIIGQDHVVADIFTKTRARLNGAPVDQPLFSCILVGPTGTGKTALPRAIAKISGHPEIVINCNTLSSEEDLSAALFGQDEGSLYTRIRRNPASVVVIDEVNTAPQSIWTRLMSAIETGEIRDPASGRRVCLRHAIVCMTSNYLAQELKMVAGQLAELNRQQLDSTLRGMLSRCANINEACLERLDSAYMMMPLEGEATVGLWQKFFRDFMTPTHGPVDVDPIVAQWAEAKHLDHGGGAGARARRRAMEMHVDSIATSTELTIVEESRNKTLTLTKNTAAAFELSGGPRSERQRLWPVRQESEETLRERYSGNNWQVDLVMDGISMASRKTKPRGPVAVVLLCGPTGGGKTFLAEQLARTFGKGDAVKIECQQAVTADSISHMLFGDSDGNGGALSRPLTLKKDRVVVFDEFSRAHKTFMDQVMNVLDEGRAIDTKTGLPVDMRQSLFMLTTNACADEIDEQVIRAGLTGVDAEEACRRILVEAGVLAPEHAERMSLILPISRQESKQEELAFVRSIIKGVLAEFGLNGDHVDGFTADCINEGIAQQGARAIRRWTEKRVPA